MLARVYLDKNALFRNNFLSYLFQNTKMTSHARVTVQITTGFHSWSVFFGSQSFHFSVKTPHNRRHHRNGRSSREKPSERNKSLTENDNDIGRLRGYRIGTQRVFVHSTWLSESLLDSFLIRRHAL